MQARTRKPTGDELDRPKIRKLSEISHSAAFCHSAEAAYTIVQAVSAKDHFGKSRAVKSMPGVSIWSGCLDCRKRSGVLLSSGPRCLLSLTMPVDVTLRRDFSLEIATVDASLKQIAQGMAELIAMLLEFGVL